MNMQKIEDAIRNNKKLFNALYPFKSLFIKRKRTHYSQMGEDIIIESIFRKMKKYDFSYIDIGANDPIIFSNTYYFYKKYKVKGCLIEPDSVLCKKLKKKRTRDICLNVGLGSKCDNLDFYVFDCDPLNTFSKEEAEKIKSYGTYHLKKIEKVKVIKFNDVVKKYFNDKTPELISLDTEGVEMDILRSIDFDKYRPVIFCIETWDYNEKTGGSKDLEIIDFMTKKGYEIYADTHLNTIFLDSKIKEKYKL